MVVQCLVDKVGLHGDARMEQIWVLAVAHKQHIADECVEAVANPDVILIVAATECLLDLTLRVILGTHPPDVIMSAFDVTLAHFLGVRAENAVQHPVGDERFGHQLLLEV